MKTKIFSKFIKLGLMALCLSFLLSATTFAADKYWVGSSGTPSCEDQQWNDTNCWSTTPTGDGGAGVPGSGDDVYFTSSDTAVSYVDAAFTVNSITIQSGYTGTIDLDNYDFNLTTGSLTVTDGHATNGSITFDDQTIDVNGALVINGGTITGGASGLGTLTVDGTTTISSGELTLNATDFAAGDGDDDLIITGGTVNLGSGTVDVEDDFELSGSATVTATSGIMNVLGTFYQHGGAFNGNGGDINAYGSINIASGTFNHGNNSIYQSGGQITGPVTLYDFTVDDSSDPYYVNNAITVENDLQYDDGRCSGSVNDKFIIKKDFSWNAGASGGNCYIELAPTLADSYSFALNDDLPVINVKDNATVSFGLFAGTVYMDGLIIDGGTLNQGTVNLTINGGLGPGYQQNGGTFTGGAGNLTCTQTWVDNAITSGSFSSGTGSVSFSRTLAINRTGDQDAQVSFNGASQVDILSTFSLGAASGSGGVTLTENTTNVETSLVINAASNMSHNDGTLVYKGDNIQSTGTFYNFTVDPDVSNDAIYTSGTLTIANNLNWTDGSCTSSGQFVVQDGFTYGEGDGGTCKIHLDSSGTETVNIAGGQNFMKMELNSTNTTVNLTGTGDSTINELDVQSGTFNQGSVNLTSSNIMNMTGGAFNGGAGSFNFGNTDLDIENGTFTAGSGNYYMEDIIVNRTAGESGVLDLSSAGLVDIYSLAIGATGSLGSVTAPGSSSNGWRIERSFYFTSNGTSFDANNGTIIFDEDYDQGYVDVPSITFNNIRIEKDAFDDDMVFDSTFDIDGDLIMEKGGLDISGETINLAGDFIRCPSNLNPSDTDCVNAGDSDTRMTSIFVSTLNLNGDGTVDPQRIGGDHSGTLYNLTKTVTAAETMYFEGGEEVKVTNQMTLTGVSGELLTLQSTNSTPAELNAESGMTVDYVAIRNVDNVRVAGDYDLSNSAKGHTENTDLGLSNQGWIFDNPYVPPVAVPEFSTWIFILTMLIGMGVIQNKFAVVKIRA